MSTGRCLLALLCVVLLAPCDQGAELAVGQEVGVVLRDGQWTSYQVSGLEAGEAYEAKVSYQAVTPASITLQLDWSGQEGGSRQLLNTEKLVFHAPASLPPRRPVLHVRALLAGVRLGDGDPDHSAFRCNIVVDHLAAPWLPVPTQVFSMVLFLLCATPLTVGGVYMVLSRASLTRPHDL